jgi:hypothetical protein
MLAAHLTSSSLRRLAALALGLAALGAPSPALADDAQAESGFALQANLGARVNLLSLGGVGGSKDVPAFNALDTQLFGGYKLGRLVVGLGLEFFNATVTTSILNASMSSSTSAFLIGPEAQFAIVRSPDSRVELLGDFALHFGHLFIPNTRSTDPSNFLLSYQLGPGVRFWAHKHFAIHGLTGFAGELFHTIPASNAPLLAQNTDTSGHGIFGSFGMLGVF